MSFASACESLLRGVPDYPCFLTVDELEAATDELACAHAVRVTELGRSREGRPVRCLTVGAGERAAVALGAPHPNEPVGVMTVSYLAERLAAEPDLAAELGVTWHLVKAWDIDGLALNEGWLKGPFTLFDYARHYFRPDFADQPDWTFPVRHKRLAFDAPTPEAACGMRLIDEVRPDLLLSLHNCSFGGAYWYETEPTPALWEPLREAARRRGVPLDLSTPEMPYARQLAPAVLGALGAEDAYDYYESLGAGDPAALVGHGTTSAAYAARRHGTFGLVCEIPYFYDRAIEDGSGCGRALSEVLLARLDWVGACGGLVEGWLSALGGVLGEKNPYRRALAAESFAASDAALRRQATGRPGVRARGDRRRGLRRRRRAPLLPLEERGHAALRDRLGGVRAPALPLRARRRGGGRGRGGVMAAQGLRRLRGALELPGDSHPRPRCHAARERPYRRRARARAGVTHRPSRPSYASDGFWTDEAS